MYDVISFGSATVDNFVDTFDRKKLTKAQQKMCYRHVISYKTGDKILIRELKSTVGGGGTNTALTFKRFGHHTAYCGCLGDDYNSHLITDYLKKEQIDFIGHSICENTGYSIILDSIKHDRTILTFKGANDKLDFKKLDKKNLKMTKLFYFSSLLRKSFETQKKIIKIGVEQGTKIAFNPSSYQACDGYKKLEPILSKTNYLILNKEEAQDVCMNNNPHPKVLLDKLKSYLAKESIVVITDGENGAYSYDGKRHLHAISKNVKVVESTGAGDAFASGFLGGILHGNNTEKSLKLAMANSQSVIMKRGAKEIILTYEEAKKSVKKNKFKVIELE